MFYIAFYIFRRFLIKNLYYYFLSFFCLHFRAKKEAIKTINLEMEIKIMKNKIDQLIIRFKEVPKIYLIATQIYIKVFK